MNLSGTLGFAFTLLFFILILGFAALDRSRMREGHGRRQRGPGLRPILAFDRLRHTFGLAVEAGQRLHVSLGWGGLNGIPAGSALLGLSLLQRVTRSAASSDRPPIATSGEGSITILAQDTVRNVYTTAGNTSLLDPLQSQLSGATPLSYAAGVLPVIYDQQVSASILAGHFGSEVALIAEAGERNGSLTLAGSDSLTAQAVLYASAQEPLIGEELYAGGAYLQAGRMHSASLYAQDVLRWVLAGIILAGAILKMSGVL